MIYSTFFNVDNVLFHSHYPCGICMYVWLWLTSDMWLTCFWVFLLDRVSSPPCLATLHLRWLPPTSHQPKWSQSWSTANSNRLQRLRWWSRRTQMTSAWPFRFAMEWFYRLSGLSIILLSATTYFTWENPSTRHLCGGRTSNVIGCGPTSWVVFTSKTKQLQIALFNFLIFTFL